MFESQILTFVLGLVLGLLVGYVFSQVLFSKNYKDGKDVRLEAEVKFKGEKMDAYKQLWHVFVDLNEQINFTWTDIESEIAYNCSTSKMMNDKTVYITFVKSLNSTVKDYGMFYSSDVLNSLSFMRDYFNRLTNMVPSLTDKHMLLVGHTLVPDFDSFAKEIKDLIDQFFNGTDVPTGKSTYNENTFFDRLDSTVLGSALFRDNFDELRAIRDDDFIITLEGAELPDVQRIKEDRSSDGELTGVDLLASIANKPKQ